MADTKNKAAWSSWDKILMLAIALTLLLAVSLTLWFKSLNANPVVFVPTPVMPQPNAYDYFLKAANSVVDDDKIEWVANGQHAADAHFYPPGVAHPYTLAQKEALIQENASAIQTLHTGFTYPYQQPPIRSFLGENLTVFEKERAFARLLGCQAATQEAAGDWNGAMQSRLDAIQMGEMMPRGGGLLTGLVGVACQAIGRRHAWETVNHLSSPQAKAAAHRLEQIDAQHIPFADTMQEEEWAGQASLLEMMHRPDWNASSNADWTDQATWTNRQTWKNQAMSMRLKMTSKRTIMDNYTHYMDQCIANAKQPYVAHPASPPVPNDPFNQTLPDFTKIALSDARAETQNRLLLVMLALRAYQQDHGAYPPTLTTLVPGYLKTIPDDPFALSGHLRYN